MLQRSRRQSRPLLFALVPSVALANGTDSVPYEANATVVVAPNAPEGSELIFDLETKTFTDIVLPNGRTLKPSRGCTNNTSACWAGGGALGDMEFTGTGAVNGNWPSRSSFYSNNKSADIGFTWKGERVYVSQIAANRKFTPNGSVDGFYVTRY
ncbi:MAG: memba [Bifidobacterium bifidum]